MIDSKEQKPDIWDNALMLIYFFVSFYGLRIALEEYLFVDDLEISYVMVLGLISGIISAIYATWLRPKTMKIKIIGLVLLLLLVIVINLLVE